MTLLALLFQFLSRLSFGLALAMSATPSTQVTSGFFRNHSYVLLGLNVLAALAAFATADGGERYLPVAAAIASYGAAVYWLYERSRGGNVLLAAAGACSLIGAFYGWGAMQSDAPPNAWRMLDVLTSGAVLGTTIGAMFLGHWYLNTPTMKISPLRNLVGSIGAAIVVRVGFAACGLAMSLGSDMSWDAATISLVSLRWLAGFVGPLLAAWMAWQTLKIPNTQSATGILYVAVIGVFLGELASLLLSARAAYPL